jgi:hypothetical protein
MLSAESPNEIDKICLYNHPNPSSISWDINISCWIFLSQHCFHWFNILALLPLHMQTAVIYSYILSRIATLVLTASSLTRQPTAQESLAHRPEDPSVYNASVYLILLHWLVSLPCHYWQSSIHFFGAISRTPSGCTHVLITSKAFGSSVQMAAADIERMLAPGSGSAQYIWLLYLYDQAAHLFNLSPIMSAMASSAISDG